MEVEESIRGMNGKRKKMKKCKKYKIKQTPCGTMLTLWKSCEN